MHQPISLLFKSVDARPECGNSWVTSPLPFPAEWFGKIFSRLSRIFSKLRFKLDILNGEKKAWNEIIKALILVWHSFCKTFSFTKTLQNRIVLSFHLLLRSKIRKISLDKFITMQFSVSATMARLSLIEICKGDSRSIRGAIIEFHQVGSSQIVFKKKRDGKI